MRICPHCKIEKPITEFRHFKTHKKRNHGVYCIPCDKQITAKRDYLTNLAIKKKCIEYKGGKCEVCGYNKCDGALEFHHKVPSQKEFSIGRRRRSDFENILKPELDKCILVCANCHRELHISSMLDTVLRCPAFR